MRRLPYLMCLMVLLAPAVANGQSFEIHGSAGPTLSDPGNSLAVGAGFSPTSRLTMLVNVERTHVSSRTRISRDVVSAFRGGTLLLGSAELRFTPAGRGRFGPFGLVGIAAGVSRPTVNEVFRQPVTNEVRAIFFGGGVEVPLNERLSVFADARMTMGTEGVEGLVAVAPARVGLAWRF